MGTTTSTAMATAVPRRPRSPGNEVPRHLLRVNSHSSIRTTILGQTDYGAPQMIKIASLRLAWLVLAAALGLGAMPAQALNTRSFISANGLDTNACTRTAPCRTLQKAH